MNQKDQLKVINAGFTILRADDQPSIRIKYKNIKHHDWATLKGPFKSKAERDREMNTLLESNWCIVD